MRETAGDPPFRNPQSEIAVTNYGYLERNYSRAVRLLCTSVLCLISLKALHRLYCMKVRPWGTNCGNTYA